MSGVPMTGSRILFGATVASALVANVVLASVAPAIAAPDRARSMPADAARRQSAAIFALARGIEAPATVRALPSPRLDPSVTMPRDGDDQTGG